MRLHYLITSPSAFVLSYTAEPTKVVFKYFLMVFVVMLFSSALIRTEMILRKLPEMVGAAFNGVKISNGTLSSEKGKFALKQWQLSEISSVVSGRTSPIEAWPESLVVVDPEGRSDAPVLISRDSLILTFGNSSENLSETSRLVIPWKKFSETPTFSFSEESVSHYFKKERFSLFCGVVFTLTFSTLADMIMYWILLLLLIFIYRRDLVQFWDKKNNLKILLNGTLPYFILMPMFAVAGNRADLQNTFGILTAAIIISRAFRFHRLSISAANQEKDKL